MSIGITSMVFCYYIHYVLMNIIRKNMTANSDDLSTAQAAVIPAEQKSIVAKHDIHKLLYYYSNVGNKSIGGRT